MALEPKVKAEWLAALRSGDFKQGKDYLRTGKNTFCCLGVLCHIKDPDPWSEHEAGWCYGHSICLLPTEEDLSENEQAKLSKMNDDGKSFSEIADYIERSL